MRGPLRHASRLSPPGSGTLSTPGWGAASVAKCSTRTLALERVSGLGLSHLHCGPVRLPLPKVDEASQSRAHAFAAIMQSMPA